MSENEKLEITLFANPEKALRHDGKLDTRAFSDGSHIECRIALSGMVLEASDSVGITVVHTYLEPQQALSLLDWLEQNKATLRQLAKEQP